MIRSIEEERGGRLVTTPLPLQTHFLLGALRFNNKQTMCAKGKFRLKD